MKVSLLCASALLACSIASAEILITLGNDPGNSNVLYNDPPATSQTDPVVGIVNENSLDFLVQFDSSETLEVQGGGQARVQSTDGSFNNVSFMSMGNTFLNSVFKLQSPGQPQPSVTFIVNRLGEEDYEETITLGNSGFVSIAAINGQRIQGINIQTSSDIDDIRQVRLGGLAEIPQGGGGEIPEPATLSLMGGALVALGVARHRRAKA